MGRPSLARSSAFHPPPISSSVSLSMARPSLHTSSLSSDDAPRRIAVLKNQGGSHSHIEEDEDIVESLRKAASLIKKDRVDARCLGMESLLLLTNPLRVGKETATIASRVVLLGSANADAGTRDNDDDIEALFDESAGLGIRETILEIVMTNNATEEKMVAEEIGCLIEKEFTDRLFSVCLAVLSNALLVSAAPSDNNQVEVDDITDDDDDRKPSYSSSCNHQEAATQHSVWPSSISKKFIDSTSSTFGGDILSSLILILGQARKNPHDAYRSALCLSVLFKECGNAHRARARTELGAKIALDVALGVGSQSHAKLEDETRKAMKVLW